MEKPFYWKARKSWCVHVVGPDGKRSTRKLGDTKAKAEKAWQKMQTLAESATPPLVLCIGEFLEWAKREQGRGHLAKTTTEGWEYYLSLAAIEFAAVPAGDLRPADVRGWIAKVETWGVSSERGAIGALKRCLNWCVENGIVPSSPLASMKSRKSPPREFIVDRPLHAATVLGCGASKYAGNHVRGFRQILIAAWLSGCRPGELASVRIEHTTEATWRLVNHKNKKKTGKARVVYLNPCLATLTRIAAAGRTTGPLFRPNHTEPRRGWKYSDFRKRFERLSTRLELPPEFVLYSYRHTWITNAMLSGIDVATVAELAGTSIQMIERHYGHLAKHAAHLADAASRVKMG